MTAAQEATARTAIEDAYTASRNALKARFPMRPSKMPAEACREFAALDRWYEDQQVALDVAYTGDALPAAA